MRFLLPDGRTVGADDPFSLDGTNYGAGWLRQSSPAWRASKNIVEAPAPVAFDERFYFGPDAPRPLDDCKRMRIADLAAIRYTREVAGTTWGAQPIWTDRETRATLTSLILAVQLGARTDGASFKFPDGPKPLANADVVPMCAAILAYVQACFDREAELTDAINDADDLAELLAVDLTQGWPT